MLEQHQWKHFGMPYYNIKSPEKKCLSGWNHGKGHSQRCKTYFLIQFNNLLTLPRQDNTPTTKAHSRSLRKPLTQSLLGNWKSSNLSLSDSELLNQPKFASSFLFFQLEVFSLMLSLQALQFNEDRAAAIIGCLKQHFLAEVCFYWGFFSGWMSKDVENYYTLQHESWFTSQFASERLSRYIFMCAVLLFNVYQIEQGKDWLSK